MTIIRDRGLQSYLPIWEEMKSFTGERTANTEDEFWLLEHYPVYTQGQAGKAEHIINPQNIEIIQSDRGGQVTYHGPGQLICYSLIDLKRINIGIRTLVTCLEDLLIKLLKNFDLPAEAKLKAPGVYINEKKIASIGLRVKNACTYHGIALNVAMDIKPFQGINPCGFNNLQMTQIKDFNANIKIDEVKRCLQNLLLTEWL